MNDERDKENQPSLSNCQSSFLPPKYLRQKDKAQLKRSATKADLDYMDKKINQDYLKNKEYIDNYRSRLKSKSKDLSSKLKRRKSQLNSMIYKQIKEKKKRNSVQRDVTRYISVSKIRVLNPKMQSRSSQCTNISTKVSKTRKSDSRYQVPESYGDRNIPTIMSSENSSVKLAEKLNLLPKKNMCKSLSNRL